MKFSLKNAVIIPFIFVIASIVLIFIFLSKNDYNYLAKEQGSRIVQALSDSTKERIKNFMSEPLRVTKMLSDTVSREGLYKDRDLSELDKYILQLHKSLKKDVKQISSVGYGDEQGRFAAIRANDARDTYNLMLLDRRTNGKLIIFKGEDINSEQVTKYEEYDPRTRPWYDVVKKDPSIMWSDIYVNYDEKMESTISALAPIYDNNTKLAGVAAIDINLNVINDFLKSDKTKGTGTIYIVDKNWKLIAHSGDEPAMKVTEGNPPTGELINSSESDNALISDSSKYLTSDKFQLDRTLQMKIGGANHFIFASQMKEPEGLDWKVIVVVPESDLMGFIKTRQNTIILITIVIALFASVLGFIILDRILMPVLTSTKAAAELSKGNWNTKLLVTKWSLKETEELVIAFNNMAINLRKSFEQIKFNEEKYKTLVENVENMIYSIDSNGKLDAVNSNFEIALNQNREMILGKDIEEIFSNEEIKLFWRNKINEVLEHRRKLSFQYEYKSSGGKRKIIAVNLIPLLKENGELQMILGSNTDITELIEAQEEIKHLHEIEKEKLEKLVQERTEELRSVMRELLDKEKLASLGSLVSGVAHEINTPLGVAVTAASYMEKTNINNIRLLEEGSMTRTDFIKYMEAMEETAEILTTNLSRAAQLVKSFKQIAVNQSIEEKADFELYDNIQSVLLSLKHEYKKLNVSFDIECPENLIINSYSGAFSQIFTNLIMNSIIHGFDGRNGGNIKIAIEEKSEHVVIVFSDDGNGIASENMSKIFDPFFTTNRSAGGSGLGLSVVYNLVTGKLGGKVFVESTVGKGTIFRIEIPVEGRA